MALPRLGAGLGGRRLGPPEWVQRLGESVHVWNAVPLALAAITLTAGGFWLGSVLGGSGTAQAAVKTVRLQGTVITVGGDRYVSTPAQTVLVRGKPVKIPARTVPLSGHTTQLPGTTIRVATTVNGTSVVTVLRTVTAPPVTVTGPTTTVAGPTTTVQDTVTVPIISTITVTVP